MDIDSLTKKSKSLLEDANDIDQLEKAYKSLLGKNGPVSYTHLPLPTKA